MLRLQLKGPSGRKEVLNKVDSNLSFRSFKELISEKIGIPAGRQIVHSGFPPKKIQCDDENSTLSELKIMSGDTIIVKDLGVEMDSPKAVMTQGHGAWEYPPTTPAGTVTKRDMPKDNSCLFHSIAYVAQDKKAGIEAANEMRQLISNIVASDPVKYNATFLGSPNSIYQVTVADPNSWGGAIELSIFATLFQTEIVAFDIHHLREDIFGSDMEYKKRAFIVYSGDHYDALTFNPQGMGNEQVIFSRHDTKVWESARSCVQALHTEAANQGQCSLQKDWRKGIAKRQTQSQDIDRKYSQSAPITDLPDSADSWVCKHCTLSNPSQTSSCSACGLPNGNGDAPLPSQPFVSDEWKCPWCTMMNSSRQTKCDTCGGPTTLTAQERPPMEELQSDTLIQNPFLPSRPQVAPRPVIPSPARPSEAQAAWQCDRCTCINEPGGRPKCEACGANNPHYMGPSPSQTGLSPTNPFGHLGATGAMQGPGGVGFSGGGAYGMGLGGAGQVPAPGQLPGRAPVAQPVYGAGNQTGGGVYGAQFPPQRVPQQSWQCPNCTKVNVAGLVNCPQCRQPNPQFLAYQGAQGGDQCILQ